MTSSRRFELPSACAMDLVVNSSCGSAAHGASAPACMAQCAGLKSGPLEVWPRSARLNAHLLAAAKHVKLDTVWSLFVEPEDMVILTSVRRAVATVGAIMFIDESSAGLRAVLAGTAPVVAVARELVQAKLLEAAAWCEPATPQVAAPRAVEDDDWVHWTHQVPLSLVGLLIGVGGNTIREMEHDTRCHLSLDRSRVHTDGPVPYLFLHIHGSQQGAAKAVSRCTDLLQRHVETLAVKSWAQQQQQQQQWAAAPAEAEELTCQAAPAWDVSAEAAWGGPMSCEVPWDAVGSASATPDGSHRMSPGTPAVDGMAGVSKLVLRSRWLREHHTSGSDEDGSMQ